MTLDFEQYLQDCQMRPEITILTSVVTLIIYLQGQPSTLTHVTFYRYLCDL